MSAQPVVLIPKCAECGNKWLPWDTDRWRLYCGVEADLDEPPALIWFCHDCAAVEFD